MEQEKLTPIGLASEIGEYDPILYQYYYALFRERTIVLNDEISSNIVETVILPLIRLDNDGTQKPIKIILNTPGGDILAGLKVIPILRNCKCPITIEVFDAFSMGCLILAGTGKKTNIHRIGYEFSNGLLHPGDTCVSGDTASVNDIIKFNQDLDEKIKRMVLNYTTLPREIYEANIRKQFFLNADEMLKYSFIDELILLDGTTKQKG